jgi:hypothetical protein
MPMRDPRYLEDASASRVAVSSHAKGGTIFMYIISVKSDPRQEHRILERLTLMNFIPDRLQTKSVPESFLREVHSFKG